MKYARYAGIDVASEKHFVAVVDEDGKVLRRPVGFGEDSDGYASLLATLGPTDVFVCMEATGHYWKNLFARLTSEGYPVAVVNPLRTSRFMGEQLERTKTDAIDCVGIARFSAQKRLAPTAIPNIETEELKETVRLRDRLVQEEGDKVRLLHRSVDLGFPEFTKVVKTLDSQLAVAVLAKHPTAAAFLPVKEADLADLKYDGRHTVGTSRAREIIAAAKVSVGAHHGAPYAQQVRFLCEDLITLRKRIKQLDDDIEAVVERHAVAKLLADMDGIGPTTAARIIAEIGDPASFSNPGKLACFVALVPGIRHSGKKSPSQAGLTNIGHISLRSALWMPMLTVVRKNPWLKAFYDRLVTAGKPKKLALCAAMRKFMTAVHWIAKNRKPFVPRLAGAEGVAL
jgi:transposase